MFSFCTFSHSKIFALTLIHSCHRTLLPYYVSNNLLIYFHTASFSYYTPSVPHAFLLCSFLFHCLINNYFLSSVICHVPLVAFFHSFGNCRIALVYKYTSIWLPYFVILPVMRSYSAAFRLQQCKAAAILFLFWVSFFLFSYFYFSFSIDTIYPSLPTYIHSFRSFTSSVSLHIIQFSISLLRI